MPLAAVLAWLAVVAVGSTAVWWVISSVGEDLGPERSVPQLVTGAPGPSGPSVPSRPSSPPSSTGSPGTPGTPGPVAHRQTWTGRGGYVTVRCVGTQAGLVAAQPDTGYAVEVGERGPTRVEVGFTGRSEDGGRRVEVSAQCVAGRPSYQATIAGGGDG